MKHPIVRARVVYEASNGDATKSYYSKLQERGAAGIVAMNLFRAQKCSTRAKLYRGRQYRSAAYERKSWSMGLLVDCLLEHGVNLGIEFGWGVDRSAHDEHQTVLYIDLPQGQVSFHTTSRGNGPDYKRDWDGARGESPVRILAYCDSVMGLEPEPSAPRPAIPPRNAKARKRWEAERNAMLQGVML